MTKIACSVMFMLGMAACAVAQQDDGAARSDEPELEIRGDELTAVPGGAGTNATCTVEGSHQYIKASGCCCDYDLPKPIARGRMQVQTCTNGNWVVSGYACTGLNCTGQACPL